jgi:hypothetical protein
MPLQQLKRVVVGAFLYRQRLKTNRLSGEKKSHTAWDPAYLFSPRERRIHSLLQKGARRHRPTLVQRARRPQPVSVRRRSAEGEHHRPWPRASPRRLLAWSDPTTACAAADLGEAQQHPRCGCPSDSSHGGFSEGLLPRDDHGTRRRPGVVARGGTPSDVGGSSARPARWWIRPPPAGGGGMLTVYNRIKLQVELQADKSPGVVKGPFFPRVVNPRYRIRGTNV